MPKEVTSRRCELCAEAAALYCPSDSAYLCWNCDSAVHSANFLVARHLRSVLCSSCGDFDGELYSGAGIRRFGSAACKSCGWLPTEGKELDTETDDEDDDSSLSSVSVTTNESSTAAGPAQVRCSRDQDCCGEVSSVMRRRERAVDARVEGVLVNWCRRLGLEGMNNINIRDDVVVETAAKVLGVTGSLGRLAFVPVRVALAASFWIGLRFCGDTCRDLKRVEKITGVPGKMILALEAKLERVLKTRRRMASHDDSKEGWAEC